MIRPKVIAIGTSSGGLVALQRILEGLKPMSDACLLITQHLSPKGGSDLAQLLAMHSVNRVKEAEDKEALQSGYVYLAPADYHVMLEKDLTLSVILDERVNFSRPAIDVMFETAADACKTELLAILLTGANADGAKGLQKIQLLGGQTIVQDPGEAQARQMPESALNIMKPDQVLTLQEIVDFLNRALDTKKDPLDAL